MALNFARLLKESLSAHNLELLRRTAAEAGARGVPLYVVGGLPRDLALGRPVTDFDLIVLGDAIRLAKALGAKFGGRVIAHSKFGTAQWTPPMAASQPAGKGSKSPPPSGRTEHLDLISARSEEYQKPGQLPQVKLGSLDDDLGRRDFTINTLAIRLDGRHFGQLHDPFRGQADLERRVVRVLHPHSFLDDPTRMYRAVRYEQRYRFRMAPETAALVEQARPYVGGLSAQRVRRELDLILDEEHAAAMLRRLGGLDLLRPIHSALPSDAHALQRLDAAGPATAAAEGIAARRDLRWLSWLIELSDAEIRSVEHRLHLHKALLEAALAAARVYRDFRESCSLEAKPHYRVLRGISCARCSCRTRKRA